MDMALPLYSKVGHGGDENVSPTLEETARLMMAVHTEMGFQLQQ
jgi:hypothetical protein